MTASAADRSASQQGSRTLGRLVLPALVAMLLPALVAAVVLVIGSTWVDRPTVTNRQDLASVEFGVPWAWLHQDQSTLEPPFPYQTPFSSPWEHPTTVSWWVFLADVGVVAAVLTVLAVAGAVLVRGVIWRLRRWLAR